MTGLETDLLQFVLRVVTMVFKAKSDVLLVMMKNVNSNIGLATGIVFSKKTVSINFINGGLN